MLLPRSPRRTCRLSPRSGRCETKFEDFLQREPRKTPTRDDFVFLGIDQSTLQLPPFLPEELANNRALAVDDRASLPLVARSLGLAPRRLFASGARLVMFDLIFNPPNDGDPAFHAALDRYRGKVVVGANFDSAKTMQAIVPNDVLDSSAADARSPELATSISFRIRSINESARSLTP